MKYLGAEIGSDRLAIDYGILDTVEKAGFRWRPLVCYGDSSLSRCIDNDWHTVPGHWKYIYYARIYIYWIYIFVSSRIYSIRFFTALRSQFFFWKMKDKYFKSSQNGRLRLSPRAIGVFVAIDVSVEDIFRFVCCNTEKLILNVVNSNQN